MFDRQDGCEYVFIWKTSEACPIHKSTGALPFSTAALRTVGAAAEFSR